jgi:hypothetical protein
VLADTEFANPPAAIPRPRPGHRSAWWKGFRGEWLPLPGRSSGHRSLATAGPIRGLAASACETKNRSSRASGPIQNGWVAIRRARYGEPPTGSAAKKTLPTGRIPCCRRSLPGTQGAGGQIAAYGHVKGFRSHRAGDAHAAARKPLLSHIIRPSPPALLPGGSPSARAAGPWQSYTLGFARNGEPDRAAGNSLAAHVHNFTGPGNGKTENAHQCIRGRDSYRIDG